MPSTSSRPSPPPPDRTAAGPSPLLRSLLTGLTGFRVACLVWLVAVLVATRGDIARPAAAVALAQTAAIFTVATAVAVRRSSHTRLVTPGVVAVDVAVAAALALGDGVVYDGPHPLSLGSAWPIASVLTAAIGFGARTGAAAGAVVGVARTIGDLLEPGTGWSPDEALSRASTLFLFVLTGAMGGFVVRRLLAAETEIALGRARAEVARTLHDGVLQTLAVVQRRSGDAELSALARTQERELRDFLYGTGIAHGGGDLGSALRDITRRCSDRDGTTVEVVVAPDLPALPAAVVAALAGAVGEACTNAAKHGSARRITVYAEPDDADDGAPIVRCSVKDDGTGFDPSGTAEGVGVTRSIRGRLAEVGGATTIAPNPGRGTEVILVVPAG